jgi:hypothetical protein
MRRFTPLVFALVITGPAHAQFFIPGRPVLVSRADRLVPIHRLNAIASNGSEFRAIWNFNQTAFSARIAGTRLLDPSGVPIFIEDLSPSYAPVLAGAGNNFLAALTTASSKNIVVFIDVAANRLHVEDAGTVRATSAVSGDRNVLFAGFSASALQVRLFANDATPVTEWLTAGDTSNAAIDTDPNGYAIFLGTPAGLTMRRLSARGELSAPIDIAVDMTGLKKIQSAFDGVRHVVVWSTTSELRGVFVSPAGAASQAFTILFGGGNALSLGMVAARSGRSLVLYSQFAGGTLGDDIYAAAIDDATGAIGLPNIVAHDLRATALQSASIGDRLLITDPNAVAWPVSISAGVADGSSLPFANAAVRQLLPSVASGSLVDLVVWLENDDQGGAGASSNLRVRAARVTGDGLVIDETPIDVWSGDSIDFDGGASAGYGNGEFLVVWGAKKQMLAARIDEQGHLVDTMPVVLGNGTPAGGVAFGNGTFLVTSKTSEFFPSILGFRIAANGTLIDTTPMVISPSAFYLIKSPAAVVFDGERFAVAIQTRYFGAGTGQNDGFLASIVYVTSAGAISADVPIQPFTYSLSGSGTLRIASNGFETLVAWSSKSIPLHLLRLDRAGNRIGEPVTVDTTGTGGSLAGLAPSHGGWLLVLDRGIDLDANLQRKVIFDYPQIGSSRAIPVASTDALVSTAVVKDPPFSGAQRVVFVPLNVPASADPARRRSARH